MYGDMHEERLEKIVNKDNDENVKNDSESAGEGLSDAQRARAERNRQRARSLRSARLAQPLSKSRAVVSIQPTLDSGGGFLLEEDEFEPKVVQLPPAPLVHRLEQPHCLECQEPFPQSYLFDTFHYSVCDNCRDDEEKHSLITRTEAKSEFSLKDCDLDSRPPPLLCVRRRNPHRARFAEMRLYLRVQVEQRALEVWGSLEALREERESRARRRERAAATHERRRLRALRMDVRSSLFDRTRDSHEHEYGPERHNPDDDVYERACQCGHLLIYEKM